MEQKIWLSLAHMGGHEQKYIQEAFDTNWVVPLGPNVDGFEADLENYLGTPRCYVAALASGTSALHLGLVQLGVGRDDEVICQSFTFSASANPIMYQGAKPVFVDSEEDTWNMSPQYLHEAIQDRIEKTGRKPKAIIPVHLYGMPAKMDEIKAVANQYDIPILEDAAEALGSKYKGCYCGTLGNFGALSFNGNKIITTSGGGALVSHSQEEKERTMFFATQAREKAPHYQHEHIGYNYRMSNICAGIGRGQMQVLQNHVEKRRANHDYYVAKLKGLQGVSVKCAPDANFESNYWLTCITINPDLSGYDREQARIALEKANIESRPLWKPMHLQPVFKGCPYYGRSVSEQLFNQGLCLPSGSALQEADLARVVSVLQGLARG